MDAANVNENADDADGEKEVSRALPSGPSGSVLPYHVHEKGVYVGNLATNVKISLMKDKLVEILNSIKSSNPIQKNHVNVICKLQNAYAFILLESSDDAKALIEAFNTALIANTAYAKAITAPGCALKCGPMFKKGTKLITKTPGSCSQRNDTGNDTNNVYPPQNNFTVAPTSLNTEDLIHQYFESKSDSHLTSKPNKQFPMHKLFYKEGEIVGAETRFLEFKQGRGSYMDRQLREHVAKYTCGFLNSEGGTLLIGVRDSGLVEGISCDHSQEDQYRLHIDSVIKMISPTIFSHMYEVYFAPVLDQDCNALKNIRVVEVSVIAGESDRLYETPEGHVYMRRDGSLQGPLHAKHIQEWTRCRILQEQKRKEEAITATLTNNQLQSCNENIFWKEEIIKYRHREEILQDQMAKCRQEEETLRRKLSAVLKERSHSCSRSRACILL